MINSVSGVPYVLPIGPGGGSSSFKIDGMALVRVARSDPPDRRVADHRTARRPNVIDQGAP